MKLHDIFVRMNENDDKAHAQALQQTGFWGRAGAGCLFFAQDTGRFLVGHRSQAVEQPGTWGTWGGAIDRGEDPALAVKREAHEETGYNGPVTVEPLLVFRKNDFRYSNFLLIVEQEFTPRLNWENQGFRWCDWGAWPRLLHFGLVSLLQDAASAATMQRLRKASAKP
jgi:8-oxo-dGTP pyrophosphatase MutT (NUDIX family)